MAMYKDDGHCPECGHRWHAHDDERGCREQIQTTKVCGCNETPITEVKIPHKRKKG